MSGLKNSLLVGLIAVSLGAGGALAQSTPPAKPAPATTMQAKKEEPSAWDQTKAMTRKQWNKAKKQWAKEKEKWADCNNQARAEKLKAPKSWSFVASCMTK